MDETYFPPVVITVRSARLLLVHVAAAVVVLQISAAVVVMDVGKLPLLSSEYWYTAFRIVVTSA